MHHGFFDLRFSPFDGSAGESCFFPNGERAEIIESIIFALNHTANIWLTGEPGTGKSILVAKIKNQILENLSVVHARFSGQLAPDELKSLGITIDLAASTQNFNEWTNQLEVVNNRMQTPTAVILEDFGEKNSSFWANLSHMLSANQILNDKIKFLLITTNHSLKKMEESSNHKHPKNDYHFFLPKLNHENSVDYIRFKLDKAGDNDQRTFTNEAIEKVALIGGGLPRQIDLICQKALESAFESRIKLITALQITENFYHIKNHNTKATRVENKYMGMDRESYFAVSGVGMLFVGVATYAIFNFISTGIKQIEDKLTFDLEQTDRLAILKKEGPVPLINKPKISSIPVQIGDDNLKQPNEIPNPDDLLGEKLEATKSLLTNSEDSEFSIQLLGGSDQKILRQQIIEIANLLEPDKLFAFRTIAQGKPYITILYGRFKNLSEAQTAMIKLPASLKSNKPYLRTLKGIRAEISSTSIILDNIR